MPPKRAAIAEALMIEGLDEDGRLGDKRIRGIRLRRGEDSWFYASSRHWFAKKTLVRSTGSEYFLPLVIQEGCASAQAELECPEVLFGVDSWNLLSTEDWERLRPALEASKWKFSCEIGLTDDYLIWLRDRPGETLDIRTGKISRALPSTTAGRVFCAAYQTISGI